MSGFLGRRYRRSARNILGHQSRPARPPLNQLGPTLAIHEVARSQGCPKLRASTVRAFLPRAGVLFRQLKMPKPGRQRDIAAPLGPGILKSGNSKIPKSLPSRTPHSGSDRHRNIAISVLPYRLRDVVESPNPITRMILDIWPRSMGRPPACNRPTHGDTAPFRNMGLRSIRIPTRRDIRAQSLVSTYAADH